MNAKFEIRVILDVIQYTRLMRDEPSSLGPKLSQELYGVCKDLIVSPIDVQGQKNLVLESFRSI